jgi:hypothetical protein
MISIKLLHFSAPDCNVQEFHYDKLDLRSFVIVQHGLTPISNFVENRRHTNIIIIIIIAAKFNKLIEEDSILKWLMKGVTYLIPKNENTENPKNYRAVTCLPTT